MPSSPIINPSGYTTSVVAAFADVNGEAAHVSAAAPLPVSLPSSQVLSVNINTATATPLDGQAVMPAVAGPYTPVLGRSVVLVLSGDWTGAVSVLRSTDQGLTKLPITIGGTPSAVFSTNCCEPIWDESEAGANLYLNISLTSGTVNYRIAQ